MFAQSRRRSQGEQTDALRIVTLGENKVNFYCLFGRMAAARGLFIGAGGDVRNTSAAASAGVRAVKPSLTRPGGSVMEPTVLLVFPLERENPARLSNSSFHKLTNSLLPFFFFSFFSGSP